MNEKLTVLSGKNMVKLLEKLGFRLIRTKGSHHIMKNDDGRTSTVPVHRNDDLPKGLMSKIVKEDLNLRSDEFESLVRKLL